MKNNAFELTNYALKLNLPFLGLAQHRGRIALAHFYFPVFFSNRRLTIKYFCWAMWANSFHIYVFFYSSPVSVSDTGVNNSV